MVLNILLQPKIGDLCRLVLVGPFWMCVTVKLYSILNNEENI